MKNVDSRISRQKVILGNRDIARFLDNLGVVVDCFWQY